MLLVVAEPWGRLFAACHGGSATDCTAPPCWSQIVYTSRSSCDLRRCPAPDGGNPPGTQGVPTQTTPATVLRRPGHPGEPARPRTRGGDLRHLPWERPGLLTEALARSERAAGRRTLPRPAARFMSGVRTRPDTELALAVEPEVDRDRKPGSSNQGPPPAAPRLTAAPGGRWPPRGPPSPGGPGAAGATAPPGPAR
jgi:hypothetical protein